MTVIVTTRDGDTVTYPTGTTWDAGKEFLFVYDAEKNLIATHHGAAWSHAKVSTNSRDALRAVLAHWGAADFDSADNTIDIAGEAITIGFLEAFKSDGAFGQMVGLAKQMLDYADENNLTDDEVDAMFSGTA
jgi:hypothetical protein